jgi:hypothetical protein
LYLHREDPYAPEIKPLSKPLKYSLTIDPDNDVPETYETDNVYPDLGMWPHQYRNTKSISILFVMVHHADEPNNQRITTTDAQTLMSNAMKFLIGTYPLAEGEVSYLLSPTPLVVTRGTTDLQILEQLRQRILTITSIE